MTAGPGEETRQTILDLVKVHGGLHKSHLGRLAKVGWGNIGHHLQVLRGAGLVDLETHGRFLWVFRPDLNRAERDILRASRPKAAQRILEALGLRQHSTVDSLSEELRISKNVIRNHLRRLKGARLVEKTDDRPAKFAPTLRKPR